MVLPGLIPLAARFLLNADAAAALPPSQPARQLSWDFEWRAPAECPDADALRAKVTRLTSVAKEPSRHLKARGVIQRALVGAGAQASPSQENTWVLTLSTELDGVTGERTLSGSSCQSLADAAALTLAIILNPDLEVPAPPPAREETPPLPPPSAATVNTRRLRPRWQVGAYAGMQTGVLRDLSTTFSLSLGVALDSLSFRLTPSVMPPQDVMTAAQGGPPSNGAAATKTGGRLWGASASGLGCWGAVLGRVTLSPCIGLDFTMLQGGGLGVLYPRDAAVFWTGGELAGFIGVRVSRGVLIEGQAIGLAPFGRPSLYLDGIGSVSKPSILGFRGYCGLAWLFD